MVFVTTGEECYVIKINKDKLVLLSHEGYVHGPPKSSPNIDQSERHLGVHESAPRSSEGGIFLTLSMYNNLIVT